MRFAQQWFVRWGTGLAMAACLTAPALAKDYPSKPITLVVPFPAGGATDVQARALAHAASKELDTQVVVMNQPGVSGTLAPSNMARQAASDGYTIVIMPGLIQRQPHLQKVSYDPHKDFTYIINVTAYTHGITVAKDAPWKDVKELLAYAKANPGKVSYGTVGKGSTANIAMERLAKMTGTDFNFVPFKGAAEVFVALVGGHIDVSAEAGFGQTVDSDRARVLAVFNEEPLKNRPDVPTLKSLGIDLVMNGSYGVAGPKNLDPAVVKTLHDAFKKAMEDPTFLKTLEQNDQVVTYMDSKTYTEWSARTYAEEKQFITELDIKLE